MAIVFQDSDNIPQVSNGQKREVGGSLAGAALYGQKLRHFPIRKGTESSRHGAYSQFGRTCPAKDKEPSETRDVKEPDVIPSEQPELKVTVTRLPSIILINFIKTKAAFDAFQCPATSPENQILKINQAGKAPFNVRQLCI